MSTRANDRRANVHTRKCPDANKNALLCYLILLVTTMYLIYYFTKLFKCRCLSLLNFRDVHCRVLETRDTKYSHTYFEMLFREKKVPRI